MRSSSDIAFVNNKKLFDAFQMTKEIKKSGEKQIQVKQNELKFIYEKVQMTTDIKEREALERVLEQKENDLEVFNQMYSKEQTEKIWNRINGYTKDFFKTKEYKIIIGSETNRDVIYADQSIDVTNDLINFINKKYEGLN